MILTPDQSHAHALETLNALYEYDDFMASVRTMADLGCGTGLDLEWWATRTTRDDPPEPLNIQCTGIDRDDHFTRARRHPNIKYQRVDFEKDVTVPEGKFDVLWCHNAFQYCINPVETLIKWREWTSDSGMLVIVVPQTMNIENRMLTAAQEDFSYHHYSLVSLIHMLAVTGWDARDGFYLKRIGDRWLHAIVYRSDKEPLDPRTTRWYDLMEQGRLPKSAEESVFAHGYLRQQDLILPWVDKSITWYGAQ